MDIDRRLVRVGEHHARVTALEQRLLYLLVANAGHVLSREQILNSIWGTENVVNSNVIDRHMRNLRTKLGDHWRRPTVIATVPGQGYRFVVRLEEAAQSRTGCQESAPGRVSADQ